MSERANKIGETVEIQDSLQAYILRAARNMRDPNIRVGKSEGIKAADEEVLKIIIDEFGLDLKGEPIKTSERYGGIRRGGYYDELHPTNKKGVYLELTFNSEDGLHNRQPSTMSLVRLDLEARE